MGSWAFLTSHAHVLLHVAANPDAPVREIADAVGITERSCQRIVADLEAGGYISRTRIGRRNHYTLNPEKHFRHPMNRQHHIGELIEVLTNVHST